LILTFMTFYYSLFGVIANIALFFNLILLLAFMSLIGATLTLPGIAGIVLTLGMAVDANVLIFERIREELRNGMAPHSSIKRGFDSAFATILDSNLTTLIVGVILYIVGTGPVKGFAVTLSLGILTSLFTAVTATRALVELVYGKRQVKTLLVGI
jgi:preprotein translocase subunit SecD